MPNREQTDSRYDVLILGGGLAGLTLSIDLRKRGWKVALVEKKTYPFHRVCGEYVSRESLPYLNSLGFEPFDHGAIGIDKLLVSSPSGKSIKGNLDLGGFSLSRFKFDHELFKLASKLGVDVFQGRQVSKIEDSENPNWVELSDGTILYSRQIVGSFGKRSNLDNLLKRDFLQRKSPYMGVKWHLKADFPEDQIELHNFEGGYAGISRVENGASCFCYLIKRNVFKKYGSVEKLEKEHLSKNPKLKRWLDSSNKIFSEPLVINEISFEIKEKEKNGLLFIGDSAGMVAPLFGNGMAMAIRSSFILAPLLDEFLKRKIDGEKLKERYSESWNSSFKTRMLLARQLQKGFGNKHLTELLIASCRLIPPLKNFFISSSHGSPF